MKQSVRSSGGSANRLLSELAAEKKKGVMALCLIAVMVLMWVRVLSKKAPQNAGAAPMREQVTEQQADSELKISFIELPNVEGRHDVLIRDFFTVENWENFGETGQVYIVSENGSEKLIRQIAEKLKLEAIELGKNPRVFINDTLLLQGDKLFIEVGSNKYECEVIGIEENAVLIRCGKTEITLKLT